MGPPNQFSEREQEVVGGLLQGKSNKQMAADLGISIRTVEFHLTNIYAKLGVRSRSEAILTLAETHLRESAGRLPVNSTVAVSGNSSENGSTSISGSMPVKKLYLILGSLAFILIAAAILARLAAQNLAPKSTASIELTPVTNLFLISPSATKMPTEKETLPAPIQPEPPTPVGISPHTVNGYTANIESYYVDPSHVIFQVRITGGDVTFGDEHYYDRIESPDLYDENGNMIDTSGGWGPAVDPELYEFALVPTTLFTGDRLKGQFAFDISNAPAYDETLAQFRFDFDLPIYRELRFYPKQTVTANGLEMLLDSVTVTPEFTQAYLCFPPPSFDPWTIGSQTILKAGNHEAPLFTASELFSSFTGNYWGIRSEPHWMPPTKEGSCFKIGFQTGSSNAASLTLTIPELEKLEPEVLMNDQLSGDYPGLSPKQAYQTYLEEHGHTYKGPWVFTVELVP